MRAPVVKDASEQVAEHIQRLIRTEGLEPGDRLGTEEALAQSFGVGRPTLREALRILAGSHLVRASKGRGGGIFVAHTPEDGIGASLTSSIAMMVETQSIGLDEMLETRILIEPPIAGLAAVRATSAQIAELREIVADQRDALGTPAGIRAREGDFHQAIAAAAENRLARAVISWAFDVLVPSLQDVLRPVVEEAVLVEHHERIVGAIEGGESQAAEEAMRSHLQHLRDLLASVAR